VKLTTHPQLVPRSKKVDLYIHSPMHLHGLMKPGQLKWNKQDRKIAIRTTLHEFLHLFSLLVTLSGKVKNFLFSTSSRPALGFTQPPIQWVPGAHFLGVKRRGREAGHSPPASAEVKKMWIYTSTPPYAFMAQCLIS
jgi:hypothetical protein